MNTRIYINKKTDFDIKTRDLESQLTNLCIRATPKVYAAYDIFNITEQELSVAIPSIFSDPLTEECLMDLPKRQKILAIEYLPGQFDLRADAAMQCCRLLFEHNNIYIQAFQVIGFDNISGDDFLIVKKNLINPVDSREKQLDILERPVLPGAAPIHIVKGFATFTGKELHHFSTAENLALDMDDLKCIQQYFTTENRDPAITEIKALDAYWSDHCRHTTFLTRLKNIRIEGDYKQEIQATFDTYKKIKQQTGKAESPVTLMEIATILPKYFVSKGQLPLYHHSKENNAATIEIEAEVNGVNEKWLLLFKNETHNHPTEIEPFGGAATCIGGAIRDPLSGRAYVYQAMRVSGAGNPLEPVAETLSGKLPQRKISKEAALGYSSYGNQIGLATSHIAEIFDEGYKAKRFECGFVIGAVKKKFVKEEEPQNGDIVLLVGGDTGRDGIGGASGSSKQHNEKSIITMQAEVQKGNALTERKIQKLFRKPEVITLIKRCNDFGAGGVCVAVGEMAEGIDIDLNKIPLKYEGLNGTEIALSESQERMAVVVNEKDAQRFIDEALKENLKVARIAKITNDGVLRMHWNGDEILNLKRSFLRLNGAAKSTAATITVHSAAKEKDIVFSKELFLKTLALKNIASQKGMVEQFDSTVSANTCFMPFGGKYQLTPADVSAHFICDETYTTGKVSLSSWGYHPEFTKANTYLGGMYAIIESVSKLVAAGADYKNIYLSFQEYFERLGNDPAKWGKPLSVLLGAFETQYQLGIAAIGGKDSMSGTFKDIHVPPTFISFAVAVEAHQHIISAEFKQAGNYIYLFNPAAGEKQIPHWDLLKKNWSEINELIRDKKIISAKHSKDGGIAATIAQMSFGNKIGAAISYKENLLGLRLGSIVFESTQELNGDFILLGKTSASHQLKFNDEVIETEEAINSWTSTFENLYPVKTNNAGSVIPAIPVSSVIIKNTGFGRPNALFPVFPGTNCEYETAHAFKKENANIEIINFNNFNTQAVTDSIDSLSAKISQSQLLVFSGGFSAGDEPDGAAKFIVNVLKNKKVKNSIHQFLDKGGLVLGICNGFQALIKSGLLPYGEIRNPDETSPALTQNSIGRHVSQMVKIKVVNEHSPWLQGMKDEVFTVPVSHGEGRFYAADQTLQNLIQQNQVATQYVNDWNEPATVFPFNPNGSAYAIEGLLSRDGKIFGRMAHAERMKEGRFKNIPGITYHNIFKNGVNYFL